MDSVIRLGPLAVILCLLCQPAAAQQADLIRQIGGEDYLLRDYSYNNARGANHSFNARLFVPEDYDPSQEYGLVMFLHGAGSNGTNNTSQVNANINNLIVEAEERNFLVYAPQAPYDYWADDILTIAEANFARAVEEYNVDPTRIYATGLSMGGAGVHKLMNDWNQTYAAFLPLSVANSSGLDASKAVGQPAWYFHGRADTVIGVGAGRGAVSKLVTAAGGEAPDYPSLSSTEDFYFEYADTRYTEIADGGHSNVVWSNGAYASDDVYDWMLSYRSQVGQPEVGQTVGITFTGSSFAVVEDAAGQTFNALGKYGAQQTEIQALGFARDLTGETTTVGLAVTGAFDKRTDISLEGITAVDDPAMAGRYWGTSYNGTSELTFTGLTPGEAYLIEIFAAIDTDGYISRFAIGDDVALLTATGNTSDLAVFNAVTADAEGHIALQVSGAGSSHRGIVNTIFISAVPEPSGLLLLAASSLLALRRRG